MSRTVVTQPNAKTLSGVSFDQWESWIPSGPNTNFCVKASRFAPSRVESCLTATFSMSLSVLICTVPTVS